MPWDIVLKAFETLLEWISKGVSYWAVYRAGKNQKALEEAQKAWEALEYRDDLKDNLEGYSGDDLERYLENEAYKAQEARKR